MTILIRRAPLTALAIAALALTACAGGGSTGQGNETERSGLDGCADAPDTCNEGERAEGGAITWVINTLPAAWSSYSAAGGSIYTAQMLHGIFPYTGEWTPSGEYQFNMDLLAEEPELLGEEPFTYQFKIRDEAIWNDGTPITGDDFVVSWKMATSPSEGHCVGCDPRSTATFDDIERMDISDSGKTVTVVLEEGLADPEWFGLLNVDSIGGGIMPAHIAAENGFDINNPEQLGQYFQWLVTTMPTFSGGPYQLVDGDLENQVIKEPNSSWYGETTATLDRFVIRYINDEGAWIPALANNEIHGASPPQFSEDTVRQLQQMPGVELSIGPGPSWEHVDFNLDNPWFADVALRRAIFTAIDVDDIASRTVGELYPEYTLRTNHIFGSKSPYHEDLLAGTGQGTGNIDAALTMLEEAGYEFDGETLTKDGEQVGPFRLRSTATSLRSTTMELIQSYLAEIGVEVTIEPADELGTMLATQDYDIVQYGWSGSPFFATSANDYWHSESASNFGKYSNPEVDRLTQLATSASSLDESASYANEAAKIVVGDAYALPIMDSPVYAFVTDDFANVRDNANTSLRALYNVHHWGQAVQ